MFPWRTVFPRRTLSRTASVLRGMICFFLTLYLIPVVDREKVVSAMDMSVVSRKLEKETRGAIRGTVSGKIPQMLLIQVGALVELSGRPISYLIYSIRYTGVNPIPTVSPLPGGQPPPPLRSLVYSSNSSELDFFGSPYFFIYFRFKTKLRFYTSYFMNKWKIVEIFSPHAFLLPKIAWYF